MWIERDLSDTLKRLSHFDVQVLLGPRQTGKTSLLFHWGGKNHELVTLDDLSIRDDARRDPAFFFEKHKPPVILDEIQYAPELFPEIKRRVDAEKREALFSSRKTLQRQSPRFLLTGSNQILMDRNIKESLAGRAAYLTLHSLSLHEIKRALPDIPLEVPLFSGGYPEIHAAGAEPISFLNNYLRSYVEKDIGLTAGVEKLQAFETVLRLLAARCGELLQSSDIASSAGVSVTAVNDWTSLLERAGIVFRLRPYATNLNKRLIKSPKIYFLDNGICARLQGHQTPQLLLNSHQAGHLFENLVLSELLKARDHFLMDWQVWFWRTRDGEEYDFIIETGKTTWVLDAKMAIHGAAPISATPALRKIFPKAKFGVVSYGGKTERLTPDCWRIPALELTRFLVEEASAS